MISPGTILQGRYEVVRLIGHGGMGAVYEALDRRLGDNQVALKQSLFATEQLRRAFEREAILLARLRHPHLPKVFDHFAESHGQFLVMEYIGGPDLEHLLAEREGAFPLDLVMEWAGQVLDALKYLHTRTPPVIHRDIKPANLKLTGEGQVVLIDFGLAKGEGGTSSVVGYSAHYAPLEQLQREGTGPESDLYSLGATLYRLLTYETPATSLVRVTEKAKQRPDPLRRVEEILPAIPAGVGRVIAHAMELDKEDRLKSAAEMWDLLRAGVEARPTIDGESDKKDDPHSIFLAGDPQIPASFEPPHSFETRVDAPLPQIDSSREEVAPASEAPPGRVTQMIDASPDQTKAYSPPGGEEEEHKRVTQRLDALSEEERAEAVSGREYATSIAPLDEIIASPEPRKPVSWHEQMLSPAPPLQPLREEAPRAKGRGRLILIPIALLLPLLLIAYWLLTRSSAPDETAQTRVQTETRSPEATPAPTSAPVARAEVLSYGLEPEDGSGRLVTETELPSGRRFRFHFRAPANGYLYLIAPDENERPTAFLTSEPGPNLVHAGRDFLFPNGENWINAGDRSKAVGFTVIFAPMRLAQLKFLEQSPRALSPAETEQLSAFRSALAGVEAREGERGMVRVTRQAAETGPVVFEIVLNGGNKPRSGPFPPPGTR